VILRVILPPMYLEACGCLCSDASKGNPRSEGHYVSADVSRCCPPERHELPPTMMVIPRSRKGCNAA
jgi:hypothetical protein